MLLTITSTLEPASDLGFLLHKHPDELQTFDLAFGRAHVFYPRSDEQQCTAALLVDVDPVGLIRRSAKGAGKSDVQYVNDRPYVGSSLLSVAINRVFRTAMQGTCKARPELAETQIPLEATIAALPAAGGEPFLRRLFEPLGYRVSSTRHPLDIKFPQWGESRIHSVQLYRKGLLKELLTHLYVLIPVMDNDKHYWVGNDEVDKLIARGESWLGEHPDRELIARRYLRNKRSLARQALDRLSIDEGTDADEQLSQYADEEARVEAKISLNERRIESVLAILRDRGVKSVVDLGCGEGKLLEVLIKEPGLLRIAGMDVSSRSLDIASKRLKLDRLPERQTQKLSLLHGSLVYRDERLVGFDAATCIEVVEHLDPHRLAAFERVIFREARPALIVVTTPNRDYNVLFESLPAGRLRHKDHRFEWTRDEFRGWATGCADRFGYAVDFMPVGDQSPEHGPPTQMAVLRR